MVKTPFETASRTALEEILTSRMQTSKYGYFISENDLEEALDELLQFFKLSRELSSKPGKILSKLTSKDNIPIR